MIKLIFENDIIEDNDRASITIPGGNGGGIIRVESDSKYVWMCLEGIKEKALLYIPEGVYIFTIPEGQSACGFEKGRFDSEFVFTAETAKQNEISEYRNLALNPLDVQTQSEVNPFDAEEYVNPIDSVAIANGEIKCFPHIYGNRITRHEGSFYARNVIDGINSEGGHGDYPYHSWGTSQYEDATIIIYFGREVIIDCVSLALRSDYKLMGNGVEHDTYWTSVTIELSNGNEIVVHPKKTGKYQEFSFDKQAVTWLRLKKLVPERTDNFASLNQIKIMGYDKL